MHGLEIDDVAFAWTYTTETIGSEWRAVRDGLYGTGVQAHIGEQVPPEITLSVLRDEAVYDGLKNPYVVHTENLNLILPQVLELLVGVKGDARREAIVGGNGASVAARSGSDAEGQKPKNGAAIGSFRLVK